MYFGDEIRRRITIYRGDRCVCGASAVITGKDGYCRDCSIKKDSFIDDIVGCIDTECLYETTGIHSSEIAIIEKFRQLMLKRELSRLIDLHFATYSSYKDNFVEPYENPSFLGLVHEKKYELTQAFLNELSGHNLDVPNLLICVGSSNVRKRLNYAFNKYQLLLKAQIEIDSNNSCDLINYSFGYNADQNQTLSLVRKYRNKYKENFEK